MSAAAETARRPRTSLEEAEALYQTLLADFDGLTTGASLPWLNVYEIQQRMAAYRTARDREIREHAERWSDSAAVLFTLQIRAEHAVDVLAILPDMRKRASKMMFPRGDKMMQVHEEQWCSSSARIVIEWNPDAEPPSEPALPGAPAPARST